MKNDKSTGGWLPFRHEDKAPVPGQESDKVFSKEGIIIFVVIMAAVIAGGILFACFFGPHV